MKRWLFLPFFIIPCLVLAKPRNPLPNTPDQVWQNDLDLNQQIEFVNGGGSNNYIKNQNILQSGATFYVSSGTVNNLRVSTLTWSDGYAQSYSLFVNVKDYGAKGDGSTDDTVSINMALSVGGTIYVPKSSSFYKITSLLNISVASTTLLGFNNPEIKQVTSGQGGINISSSNVTIDGIILTGVQNAAANITENAIVSSGTASARLSNIEIKNCTIRTWGEQGIRFNYVNGAVAKNNHVYNIVYSGIQGRHTNYADFSNNHVHDIGPGDTGVLVGISLTGTTTQDDVPYLGVISNNRIHDLLSRTGQGILVEPCDSCSITGNTIADVGFGIGVESQLTLISKNNIVSGNTIVNKKLTAYADRITGILLGGTDANTANYGNVVSGNNIFGYGTNNPSGYGAIHLYYNENCSVTGNNISTAAVYGIYLLASNKQCIISGNNISSMSISGATAGIATSANEPDDYSLIDGNHINVIGANAILIQGNNGRLHIGKNYLRTNAISDISGDNTYATHQFMHRDATVSQLTGTVIETNLRISTISANSMSKNETIRVIAWGDKAGALGNKTIKLYFGSTAITFNAAANDTNAWRVEADIIATGATNTQTIYWKGWNGTTMLSAIVNPTEDTTNDLAIKCTGTLGNATDFITQRGFIIERF